jgi:hypothetical protein
MIMHGRKLIIVLMLFLIFAASAYATGLSPGKRVIIYEPGMKVDFKFSVHNNEGPDKYFYLMSRTNSDDLKENLKEMLDYPKDDILIRWGGSHEFTGSIYLPAELGPGEHNIFLTVFDKGGGSGQVGARATVAFRFEIYSPYPGKYAKGKVLPVQAVKYGETAVVNIEIMNLGTDDLASVSPVIDLYSGDEFVKGYSVDSEPMKSKDVRLFKVHIPTDDLGVGKYSINAKIMFDGLTETVITYESVRVGDIEMEITKISNPTFIGGRINKFDIGLMNKWNTPTAAFVEGVIRKNGRKKGDFRTESITATPWEENFVTAYLDATNLIAGVYDLHLTLKYAGKTASKVYQVRILPGELQERPADFAAKEGTTIPWIPVLMIVVLILVNLLAYTYLKGKKLKG